MWKDKPLGQQMPAMRKAASLENFLLRRRDVHAVLDQLGFWNKDESHPLAGRLDLGRIGMSGHSFGAVTTQAVSGQVFPIGKGFTDPKIKAAVLMSPSPPRAGGDPKKAFGDVNIPWMVLTGTDDNAPIGESTPKSRLTVFPALPPGGKYELVLDKAEHSAFGDRELPGEAAQAQPQPSPSHPGGDNGILGRHLWEKPPPGSGSTARRCEAFWRRRTGGRGSDCSHTT